MKTNVSLEEAQEIILEKVSPRQIESVPLSQGLGRILASNIICPENVPSFNRSPLDGYALIAEDTLSVAKGQKITLKVLEEVLPGGVPFSKVLPGTAVKVLTGSLLPEGANTVVRFEDVVIRDQYIEIKQELKPYVNVVFAGEDVKINDMAAEKGTKVNGPLIGLLAAMGISQISVYNKVKVALLSTGDELVDISEPVPKGKIRNSNIYSIVALCQEKGALSLDLGVVKDRQECIREKFFQALMLGDIVISTGGVSVGDYDLVKAALIDMGADILFWKVAMKPGSPTLVAMKEGKPIICLSGNPAAAMVGFELIAFPVIKKMMGEINCLPQKCIVIMSDDYAKSGKNRRLLRGRMVLNQGQVQAKLTGSQDSCILRSMVECNLLIDIPSGKGPVAVGDKLTAFAIRMIDNFV